MKWFNRKKKTEKEIPIDKIAERRIYAKLVIAHIRAMAGEK